MTPEQSSDLEVARYLAECGVPIFLADPLANSASGTGYHFPTGWQNTEADPSVVDDWKPGMALCAVMGHTIDGIDKDPRSGGDLPEELQPKVYGRQSTPSGGTHDFVAPLGVNSRDGLLDGVDIKAGKDDGSGRGFLFIAPTVRVNKSGQKVKYRWDIKPDLDALMLVGGDDSGQPLADLINKRNDTEVKSNHSYSGPEYDDLNSGQKGMAKSHQAEKLEYWKDLLEDAETWDEGYRDHQGRGWEALTRDFAWALASYATTPWMPLQEDEARDLYDSMLPQPLADDPKCRGKWYEGLLEKAGSRSIENPPWSDFDVVELETSKKYNLPESIDEYGLAEWLVEGGLGVQLVHSGPLGWLVWDGKRWKPTRQERVKNRVIRAVKMANHRAKDLGLDQNVLKKLGGFKTESKTKALTELVKALVADDGEVYDSKADLLNVDNGVVDLRTGNLQEHDPEYRFTKITPVKYDPTARHEDFDQVLSALEPEVRDWMQIRFGQAATGYMTSDDVMPIGIGGGSNGKTTLITVMRNAMGDFQVTVPNKLILGNPNDHPTEQTMLMGARMAFIDETPEGRYLNVGLVKTLLGTSEMSARKIAKDTMTWKSTHSLFLMTNHLPHVSENDDGTTRRLALVRFDKKFRRDDAFRARVIDPQGPVTEAALAWIVEGAKRWYGLGKSIPDYPEKVRLDTNEWLEESDPANEYIESRFVLDPNSRVLAKEITEDLNLWLTMNSMNAWSKGLTLARLTSSATFKKHGIRPARSDKSKRLLEQLDLKFDTEVPSKPVVYRGIRWRKQDEPMGFDPSEVKAPEFAEELI